MQFGCHQLSLQQQQQQQSLSPKFLGWLLILNKLVRVGHMYSKSNNSNCSRIWKKKWKNLIFTHNKKKKKKNSQEHKQKNLRSMDTTKSSVCPTQTSQGHLCPYCFGKKFLLELILKNSFDF